MMGKNIRVLASIWFAGVFIMAGCGTPSGSPKEWPLTVHVDNDVPQDFLCHVFVSKGDSKQEKEFDSNLIGANGGIGMPKLIELKGCGMPIKGQGDEADLRKPNIRVEVLSD